MTILSEHLEAIFQEINTNFAQHRQIHVTPVAGTPPEQYRITYHLQGLCKEDDGEVRECTDHIIILTLPFGFPHFPPNCKPETPVFHPDFDQAAICIGEFWESNQSLSELILHMGSMLCGEIYSSNNAFNEEAAAWYKKNQQRLPLDTIDQLSSAAELSAPEEKTDTSSASLTMDIVDDAFFSDNEIRETEADEVDEKAEETLPPHLTLQPSSIDTPSPEPDSDLDGPSQHSLINKAREKHAEGEASEHQGQADKKQRSRRPAIAIGGVCLGSLLILMCTYLFLNSQWKHTQTMVKECKQLLDTRQLPEAAQICTEALEVSSRILFIKQEEKKLLTEEVRQLQDSIKLAEELAQSKESNTDKLPDWQQSMKLADQFLADSQWKDALTGYTRTLQLASGIPTLDHTILDQIRNNHTTAEFNIALQSGEQALARAEWDSAKNHIDRAMKLAKKNPQISSASINRIKSLLGKVEFSKLMASGNDCFSQGDWTNALTAFNQAQEIERKFTFSDEPTRASLQEFIVKSKVFNALEQGKKAFAEAQWDQAINQYETAVQLLEENSEILRRDNPLESQQKISRIMLHAAIIRDKQRVANHLKNKELSQAIDKMQAIIETIAMSSFVREEEFQTIIKETRLTINQTREDLLMAGHISYLTDNYQKLFTQNNPALNAERLSRPRITFLKKIGNKRLYKVQCFEEGHERPVLLQASYIHDPITNKWHFFNKDNAINEQETVSAGQKMLSSAYQAQEDRVISEQISYLTDNFQTLFIQTTPSLLPESLSRPQARFLRKIGEKMLFMLQCFDQEAGNSAPLKAGYLYDPASKQWEPYNNEAK